MLYKKGRTNISHLPLPYHTTKSILRKVALVNRCRRNCWNWPSSWMRWSIACASCCWDGIARWQSYWWGWCEVARCGMHPLAKSSSVFYPLQLQTSSPYLQKQKLWVFLLGLQDDQRESGVILFHPMSTWWVQISTWGYRRGVYSQERWGSCSSKTNQGETGQNQVASWTTTRGGPFTKSHCSQKGLDHHPHHPSL